MIRALLLLAIALPASAQQAPAEPAKKAPERPLLNLKLDNPSSWATTAPAEKEAPKGLPALGGDARAINPGGANAPSRDPIPKDTNPSGR